MSEKPFKNREEVKAEMRRCGNVGDIASIAGLIFAALGVIVDAFDVTLLESMSWFLLAIFAEVSAIMPTMHKVVAKHLYGIESEKKQ
jgi:hypothetical protein